MVLPVGVIPSFPNGVWRLYMMIAVVVAISTATLPLPLLEKLHRTLTYRRNVSMGVDSIQPSTHTGGKPWHSHEAQDEVITNGNHNGLAR